MPTQLKDVGDRATYRRQWFELRAEYKRPDGVFETVCVKDYEGEGAFDRACEAAKSSVENGYKSAYVVRCHLAAHYRVEEKETTKDA